MSQPATILDYASPQHRRWLAMPADTRLDWKVEANSVQVVARMQGQVGAILGMLFACFILLLYAFVILQMRFGPGTVVVLAFWVGYATLLGLVVRNTWRQTILLADREYLRLAFTTPLSRRQYEWTADQVTTIEVVPVRIFSGNSDATAELLINIRNGSPVRLFGGHHSVVLVQIAQELRKILLHSPQRVTPVSLDP